MFIDARDAYDIVATNVGCRPTFRSTNHYSSLRETLTIVSLQIRMLKDVDIGKLEFDMVDGASK